MTELETHIEKKLPFVIETKEGDQIVIFPAEKRFIKGEMNVVIKTEVDSEKLIKSLTAEHRNFQSLRPNKNEKTD